VAAVGALLFVARRSKPSTRSGAGISPTKLAEPETAAAGGGGGIAPGPRVEPAADAAP